MKKLTFLLVFISIFGYAQTPITDANFQTAINTCLSTNPVDGMCSDSEYGAMPNWDVSQVTDMSNALRDRNDFNADLSNWDVSSVTNMYGMFWEANSFNQPIGDWDVSNVTNMIGMLRGSESEGSSFNQDISSWNVVNVTNMNSMFYHASSFNQPVGNWDVRNVTDMRIMFMYASSFDGNLSSWDVSNVTEMGYMFNHASSFNQPVENWDVSNVTDMSWMFDEASSFNQTIGDWDVSNVIDMYKMFNRAVAFNQDISNWCVTNIVSEPTDFSTNSPLSESNKPVWGSCPTASIDDQYFTNLSVFPNPVENSLFISGNDTPISVSIYNMLGKEILSIKNTNNINVEALPSGMYLIRISDGVGQTNGKFIKN